MLNQKLTIYIEDLKFNCIIGILPFERKKEQEVIINIKLSYIYDKKNFIDYSEISKLIETYMKKKKFKLIEDAIKQCEKKLYKLYRIENLKLKITKPNILSNCKVSVSN